MANTPNQKWTEVEERGKPWFFKPLLYLHQKGLINWWTARLMLYPIMTFYFLTDRNLRNASLKYLRKLTDYTEVDSLPRRPGLRHAYIHILEFGRNVFDRFAFWMGYRDRYRISEQGEELFFSHASDGRGAMLLSFHAGNYYLMRYMAMKEDVKVNIVAYWDASPLITDLLEQVNPDSLMNIIHVDPDNPQSILDVKERIDRGELVAILGDRESAGSSSRSLRVPFLGGMTSIPAGPYLIASLLDCPILLTYAIRTGPRSYELNAEEFVEEVQLPRSDRQAELRRLATKFAGRMEDVCRRAPYQWFNFYDFWEDPQSKKKMSRDHGGEGDA